ncbi:MAG: FAD-dependent oxidoreductase [Kofleriaceae bacterium]|nr:FAD-dependent oxidoreductase [Kofleriaceae bacterium]
MLHPPVDLAVIGAGTAGAAAAAFLAERGLKVVVLERRTLAAAGARWVNGVPRGVFRAAGVAVPTGDEDLGGPHPFHMIAPGGRVRIDDHDVIDVDMRALVARLQARAMAAGVTFLPGVAALGRDRDLLRTSGGPIRCRWIVDASGLGGAGLLPVPDVAPHHLCAAAQEIREVRDAAAARAYFDAHDVGPGEALVEVGVAGGFSVRNVRLFHGGATVGILTGSIPALGHPPGKVILDRFVAAQPWIGRRVYGGAGAIPLRRPHDRLADDQVALLGDAGCQVFPAHGSGIGAGMLAARLLADVVADGGSLRDYEVGWQRRHGGLHASFDVVRRWNQGTDAATLGRIMALGLIDAEVLRAGLDQAFPRIAPRSLPGKARALIGAPSLARGIATTLARGAAVRALYARYPAAAARVPAWSRRVDWVVGA